MWLTESTNADYPGSICSNWSLQCFHSVSDLPLPLPGQHTEHPVVTEAPPSVRTPAAREVSRHAHVPAVRAPTTTRVPSKTRRLLGVRAPRRHLHTPAQHARGAADSRVSGALFFHFFKLTTLSKINWMIHKDYI